MKKTLLALAMFALTVSAFAQDTTTDATVTADGTGVTATATAPSYEEPVAISEPVATTSTEDCSSCKQFFVNVGLGPSIGLAPRGNDTEFKLIQEFGYKFWKGLFGAVSIGETFINSGFIFNFGARIGYDIDIAKFGSMDFSLAPSVLVGAALINRSIGPLSVTNTFFNLAPSVEGRLFFTDMFGVFLRPQFNIIFPDAGDATMDLDLLVGGTLRF